MKVIGVINFFKPKKTNHLQLRNICEYKTLQSRRPKFFLTLLEGTKSIFGAQRQKYWEKPMLYDNYYTLTCSHKIIFRNHFFTWKRKTERAYHTPARRSVSDFIL